MDKQQQRKTILLIAAILAVAVIVLVIRNNASGNDILPVVPSAGRTIGSPDAKVLIIEYSDFECPYCGVWEQQTFPGILKDYIATGKAKLEYRFFPLNSIHANAQKAAEAAACAEAQGKFWEMHDTLYRNQQDLQVSNLKSWARQLGMDGAAFDTCLDTGAMASTVGTEAVSGQTAGVTGTPAFIINGKLIVGAQPYVVFKKAIDDALR